MLMEKPQFEIIDFDEVICTSDYNTGGGNTCIGYSVDDECHDYIASLAQ